MNALAELRVLDWLEFGPGASIGRIPSRSAVIGSEDAYGGDGNVHPEGIGRVELDGVEAKAAGSGVPTIPGGMLAESGDFVPGLPGIFTAKERRGRYACIHNIGSCGPAGLDMPDPLEFQAGAFAECGAGLGFDPGLTEIVRVNNLRAEPGIV